MEKKIINPWKWQDNFGYAQAVEIKNNYRMLYCSGQASVTAEGTPVGGSMEQQIQLSLANLEKVINDAGYAPSNIIRLNFFTTSISHFFPAYGTLAGWMAAHGIKPASTLVEVQALAFPELTIELEATVAG